MILQSKLAARSSSAAPRGQRGVVLILALVMLVSMTLAGIALYRQIGTGLVIARNLTFQRAAIVAADLGLEAARTWVTTQAPGDLLAEQQVGGAFVYYPAWCYGAAAATRSSGGVPVNCGNNLATADFDPLNYDWTQSRLVTSDDGAGNEVRYVIHRLCALPGGIRITDTPGQRCAIIGREPAGQTQGVASYGGKPMTIVTMPYYRITARVRDRQNTIAYTQAIIY